MFLSFNCKNCRLLYPYCFRYSKPFSTGISEPTKKTSKAFILNKSGFKVIYELPYIGFIGAVLKTKQLIPGACVAVAPVLYYVDATNVAPILILSSAVCYYLTGMICSRTCNRMVGKIYISTEGDMNEVMISSINHVGKRIDRIHKHDEIINVEFPTTIARSFGFIRLVIQNSDIYYNVNINTCKFHSRDACEKILGIPQQPSEKKNEKDGEVKKELTK